MKLINQVRALIRQMRGNMTQVEAAATIGVNPQTWSRWERGEHVPDLQTLQRIAKAFGYKPEITPCPPAAQRCGSSSRPR